jgi:hypothetical protein
VAGRSARRHVELRPRHPVVLRQYRAARPGRRHRARRDPEPDHRRSVRGGARQRRVRGLSVRSAGRSGPVERSHAVAADPRVGDLDAAGRRVRHRLSARRQRDADQHRSFRQHPDRDVGRPRPRIGGAGAVVRGGRPPRRLLGNRAEGMGLRRRHADRRGSRRTDQRSTGAAALRTRRRPAARDQRAIHDAALSVFARGRSGIG